MIIRSATFIKSSTSHEECPGPVKPEFGFIGRSNVGKSSLINMLAGRAGLAKISGQPGKTRTINHFLINDDWYIADLPGYGYAKVPVKMRLNWSREVEKYILERINLVSLFVLIDSRLRPQNSDLDFMEFLGVNQIPFARVFTKSDKLSVTLLEKGIMLYNSEMLKQWESLPATFISSSVTRRGRDEILGYIEESINKFSPDGLY
ncbi:MAG: ribosome biogenesis GTP-binding protein YihA/YsxC [Bacteroidales bacterium]